MEHAGHEVADPPSPPSLLPPVLAPILMMVFWMLLGGAVGIKMMEGIWRIRGVEVGRLTIAVSVGGTVGAADTIATLGGDPISPADAFGDIGLEVSLENQIADETQNEEELERVLVSWDER